MTMEFVPRTDGLNSIFASNVIQRVDIDSVGILTINGRDLPDYKMIYRLALQKGEVGVGISSGLGKNYIHVVLDNQSALNIYDCDPFTNKLANCLVDGNPESTIIQDFYNKVLPEMMEEEIAAFKVQTKTKSDFLRLKHFEIFKEIADTCQYLIPSIMSIQLIGEENLILAVQEDPAFFEHYLDKVNALDPDHPYTQEINFTIEKIMTQLFGKKKDYSSWYPIAGLSALCLFLLFHNLRLRQQLKIARRPINQEGNTEKKLAKINSLSPKEREVFALMQTSLSNKEIASKLFIETTTVKSHISKIYQKLQISSRQEISQFADFQGRIT